MLQSVKIHPQFSTVNHLQAVISKTSVLLLLFNVFSCLRSFSHCIGSALPVRSLHGFGWNDDILKFVLGDDSDCICIYTTSVTSKYSLSRSICSQMPITRPTMAAPVIVFLIRYGARARSKAGDARMRAS